MDLPTSRSDQSDLEVEFDFFSEKSNSFAIEFLWEFIVLYHPHNFSHTPKPNLFFQELDDLIFSFFIFEGVVEDPDSKHSLIDFEELIHRVKEFEKFPQFFYRVF